MYPNVTETVTSSLDVVLGDKYFHIAIAVTLKEQFFEISVYPFVVL